MNLLDLATSPFIIIAAYIAAFLPWTAFAAKDFISSKWKSVKTTRREGYINLVFSLAPAGYILFYCVTQAKGGELPEMAAALVAMVFALLHASRTTWGLWQLNYYRQWCKRSINALRAMGIEYRLSTVPFVLNDENKGADYIADNMLVNDSIVDNQLLHGNTVCFVRYGRDSQYELDCLVAGPGTDSANRVDSVQRCSALRSPIELRMPRLQMESIIVDRFRGTFSLLTLPHFALHSAYFCECVFFWLLDWLRFCVLFIFFCLVAFVDVLRYAMGIRTSGKLHQVPQRPEEVWLNWSVVFVAQGLQTWIADFDVAEDPDATLIPESMKAMEHLEKRLSYYASEVLSSAVMQLWPELSDSSSSISPFFWNLWKEKSHMAEGRLVKDELLRSAIISGRGLPFGVPHSLRRLTQRRKDHVGYGIYHRHLNSVIAALSIREEFCAEIDDFNIEMLEWLTVLLSLGSVASHHSVARIGEKNDSDLSSDVNEDQSQSSHRTAEGKSQAQSNLAKQLNWSCRADPTGCSKSRTDQSRSTTRIRKKRPIPLSFPINFSWETLISDNRHVLKVGEVIDVWLALSSGDGVSFLLKVNPAWKDISKGNFPTSQIRSQSDLLRSNQNAMPSINCSMNIREIHEELEQRRLRYQFADERPLDYSLSQYMTFMGYRMENVRTGMAQWLLNNRIQPDVESSASLFHVDMKQGKEKQEKEPYRCKISAELSNLFRDKQIESALLRRCVQSRLIWELQEQLEESINTYCDQPTNNSNGAPSNLQTILRCILCFPSLQVVTEPRQHHSSQSLDGQALTIHIDPIEEDMLKQDHQEPFKLVQIRIIPVCAPQDCYVLLTFDSLGLYHRLTAAAVIIWESSSIYFKWGLWRDAFLGRLSGKEKWRKDRLAKAVDLFVTKGPLIADFDEIETPTGDSFTVWKGWMPFRVDFCKFEVENSSLLGSQLGVRTTVQLQNEQNGTRSLERIITNQRQMVNYDEAQPRVLKHASTVIRNCLPKFIFRLQDEGRSENVLPQYNEDLLSLADRLSTEDECDIERIALLYESAALEYERKDSGREPLTKCVNFLFRHGTATDAPTRIVSVLTKFIANLLPRGEKSVSTLSEEGRKTLLEVVYPACEKLTTEHGHRLREGMEETVLGFLLILQRCNRSIDNTRKMRSLMELMITISQSYSLIAMYARSYGFPARGDTDSQDILIQLSLYMKEDYVVQYFMLMMLRQHQPSNFNILNSLAKLLVRGAEGVTRDAVRAKELFEEAIMTGDDLDAVYNLANLLLDGAPGVEVDAPKAVELYERAIKEGRHSGAMYRLAKLLHKGAEGVQVDSVRAVQLYEQAIEEGGRTDAMYYLANLLNSGAMGVNVDVNRALQLLECAVIERGNTDAMVGLAWILSTRLIWCEEANAQRAVKLYERAIKEGRTDAMFFLASLLLRGGGGMQANAGRAVELFEYASNEGRTDAMVALARILTTGGDGVEQDVGKAATLYERAISEGGRTDAMVNLALLLTNGRDGLAADAIRAEQLFKQAIEKDGRTDAMVGLACLKMVGAEGVEADAVRAVELFERAMRQDENVYAIQNLADALTHGAPGVGANPARAVMLLERALQLEWNVNTVVKLWRLLKFGTNGLAAQPQRAQAWEAWAASRGVCLQQMGAEAR